MDLLLLRHFHTAGLDSQPAADLQGGGTAPEFRLVPWSRRATLVVVFMPMAQGCAGAGMSQASGIM
jgi:hypothetical protein